jgi:hypothetical protein
MSLIPDWQHVLRKAWSLKLMVLAGVLSGVEIILPMFSDSIPRGIFAALSAAATASAFVARLLAQRET